VVDLAALRIDHGNVPARRAASPRRDGQVSCKVRTLAAPSRIIVRNPRSPLVFNTGAAGFAGELFGCGELSKRGASGTCAKLSIADKMRTDLFHIDAVAHQPKFKLLQADFQRS